MIKFIWDRIDDKARWITTTLAGLLWPMYVMIGNPLGAPGATVRTILWFTTGIVIVRMIALIMMIVHVARIVHVVQKVK